MESEYIKKIFSLADANEFEKMALELFNFQYNNNSVYREYASLILDSEPQSVKSLHDIPFLPIRFFKSKKVVSFTGEYQAIFTSSSTTGMVPAQHFVKDLKVYEESFLKGFELFYGDISEYDILALLPSYLEREGSSLVYMAQTLIEKSIQNSVNRVCRSGFYLYNYKELYETLSLLQQEGRKVILLGVTFALIDFCKEYKMSFPELIIMETGGMKGRGKEINRNELHKILYNSFGTRKIHSEYGMAELMSQAYLIGEYNGALEEDTLFFTPPWMKVLVRNLQDPFSYNSLLQIKNCNSSQYQNGQQKGELGGINIIDLANVWSCAFIETEDIGRYVRLANDSLLQKFAEKSNTVFTVEGRIQNSERRGCNMLIE